MQWHRMISKDLCYGEVERSFVRKLIMEQRRRRQLDADDADIVLSSDLDQIGKVSQITRDHIPAIVASG